MSHSDKITSEMGRSYPDRILVRNHDLVEDLLGKLNLGDMAWLEITGRKPSVNESQMFNALLLTLVEHGMTPMAIATRLTYFGAPESLQAAVGAGLSGLGTAFAGTAEGAARILQAAFRDGPNASLDELASKIVADHVQRRTSIPGIGHPLHKPVDPRTVKLFEIARTTGYAGRYVELMQKVGSEAERVMKKNLPVNATGAMGAIALELGFDWRLCRGIAVVGRAVGLVGHIAEEIRNPIARHIWEWVEETASAQAKAGETS